MVGKILQFSSMFKVQCPMVILCFELSIKDEKKRRKEMK